MNNKILPFLLPYAFFLLLGGFLLLAYPKGTAELWTNKHLRADSFFFWITYLGDGILYVLVSVLIGIKNKRWGAFALACYALTGLFTQFLKIVVFPDVPRPSAFFPNPQDLHFVAGVEIHTSNSFPSGHTTSAFSLGFLLSLYGRQGALSVLCAFGAILAGFSRIYLMQHFLADVYVGSLIGVFGTWLLYGLLRKWLKKPDSIQSTSA